MVSTTHCCVPLSEVRISNKLLCLIQRIASTTRGCSGRFLYDVRAEQPELAMWFAGALVATVLALVVMTRASLVFGIFVSRMRSGDWVPVECRNPLASKVAQHKFKDQVSPSLQGSSLSVS